MKQEKGFLHLFGKYGTWVCLAVIFAGLLSMLILGSKNPAPEAAFKTEKNFVRPAGVPAFPGEKNYYPPEYDQKQGWTDQNGEFHPWQLGEPDVGPEPAKSRAGFSVANVDRGMPTVVFYDMYRHQPPRPERKPEPPAPPPPPEKPAPPK